MPLIVFWDMDGTLVDSEPLHEEALTKALADHGATPSREFHDAIVGRDAEAVYEHCRDHYGINVPFQDWLKAKYQHYFGTLDRLTQREGAVDLFLELDGAGARQAVVSNSDRLVVQANLDAAGISAPRRVTVSRNDVRHGKPDGECYLRAAWLMGADPADCFVVEDSATGASAGVAAGCQTLFWPQGVGTPPEGARQVDSLAALTETLKAAL